MMWSTEQETAFLRSCPESGHGVCVRRAEVDARYSCQDEETRFDNSTQTSACGDRRSLSSVLRRPDQPHNSSFPPESHNLSGTYRVSKPLQRRQHDHAASLCVMNTREHSGSGMLCEAVIHWMFALCPA